MKCICKVAFIVFLSSGMLLAQELSAQAEFEKKAVYIEFSGAASSNRAPVYPGIVNDSNWSKCISTNKIKTIAYPFDGLSNAYLKNIAYVSFQDSILQSNLSDVGKMSGVGRVYRLPMIAKFTQPNDKYLKSSWFYSALRFPEAWQMSDGSGVRIAIIDDAFKTDHEDLTVNLWVNPNEIPADAIDNDSNGFVDDIHGWDLADNDGDIKLPVTYTSIYTSNHGTMVTGVAASAFNNLKGIPGVGFRAQWMGVKCKADFDINNTFISYSTDPMQGIAYAVQAGADIINLSFGYQDTGISPIHKALLDHADSLGVLVVAAAGNDNNNLSSPSFSVYPAAYDKVISVASISQSYLKSVHSNYGSRAGVDIAAPGYCLFTTGMDNTAPYIIGQGTSLSSPLVAGLLGLVKSKHPTYSSAQIRSCLENAAERNSVADPLSDQLGHGIINAELAVDCRQAPSAWFTNYLYKSWVCKGDTISYLYLHDTDYTYRFNFGDDSNWHTPGINGRIIHAFGDTGCYNVTLRIFDTLNQLVNEKTLTNFTRVASCLPKYLSNTKWFFGRAVGLHFTSSGPVPSFDYPLWAEGSTGVLNSFTGRHLNSFYNRFGSEYITALPSDFNQATAISGFIQEGGSIYKAYSQNILTIKHPSDTTITFGLFMDHEAHPTSGKHNARYGWFKSDGSAYGLFPIPPMPGSIVCADSSAYIGGGFAAAPMDSSKGWWVFAHGKPDDTHADYPTSIIIYKTTYITSSPGVKVEYHGYHNYGKLADVNHMRLKVSPNGKYLAVHNFHYLSNRIYLFQIDRIYGGLILIDSTDYLQYSSFCFSPDSRFIYAMSDFNTEYYFIRQFDCSDMSSYAPLIYYPEKSYNYEEVTSMELGPDNMVYINLGSKSFLHRIENPNHKASYDFDPAVGLRQYAVNLRWDGTSFRSAIHSGFGFPNVLHDPEEDSLLQHGYRIIGCDSIEFSVGLFGPSTVKWSYAGRNHTGNRWMTNLDTLCRTAYTIAYRGRVLNDTVNVLAAGRFVLTPYKCDSFIARFENANCSTSTNSWYFRDTLIATNVDSVVMPMYRKAGKLSVQTCHGQVEVMLGLYEPDINTHVKPRIEIAQKAEKVFVPAILHRSDRFVNWVNYTWFRNNVALAAPCSCDTFAVIQPGIYHVLATSSCGDASTSNTVSVHFDCNSPSFGLDYFQSGGVIGLNGVVNSDQPQKMTGRNIVQSGNIFEVYGGLLMDECSEIVVEPGGTLFLDSNAHISSCGRWKGITILGDTMTNFGRNIRSIQHGSAYIRNARILHADVAVQTMHGGYLEMRQTKLDDNYLHVAQRNYPHFDQSRIARNRFGLLTSDYNGSGVLAPCDPMDLIDSLGEPIRVSQYQYRIQQVDNDSNYFTNEPLAVDHRKVTTCAVYGRNTIHTNFNSDTFLFLENDLGIYQEYGSNSLITNCRFRLQQPMPARPTAYRSYAGLFMRNMQGSYVANNTFHELEHGIQYYQLASPGVFNTDINENTFNTCGVGLTIAPLQNPYNLSLPLNPYGVLQQLTFYCNTFNNGNIGFIGCGEVPVHGSLSNGAGNEFNNLNIANGIWGGLDTLEYYFDGIHGNSKDPRLTSQPTQTVICNGDLISSHNENNIYDDNRPISDFCGLAPSYQLDLNPKVYNELREFFVYPNPTNNGRLHLKRLRVGKMYYKISNSNGVYLLNGVLESWQSEIILPPTSGMYFLIFYDENAVVARFKVIRL